MIEQKSGVGFAVDNKKSYNRLFVQNRSGVIVFLAQIDFFLKVCGRQVLDSFDEYERVPVIKLDCRAEISI